MSDRLDKLERFCTFLREELRGQFPMEDFAMDVSVLQRNAYSVKDDYEVLVFIRAEEKREGNKFSVEAVRVYKAGDLRGLAIQISQELRREFDAMIEVGGVKNDRAS
ncbi:hypothetical protein [Carnimonas bestiolae]|uniref:hypothetical protein n=1 Tax=Carnimonas bestiolae TaxID=3402172 RepID=UPI003EDBE1B5